MISTHYSLDSIYFGKRKQASICLSNCRKLVTMKVKDLICTNNNSKWAFQNNTSVLKVLSTHWRHSNLMLFFEIARQGNFIDYPQTQTTVRPNSHAIFLPTILGQKDKKDIFHPIFFFLCELKIFIYGQLCLLKPSFKIL